MLLFECWIQLYLKQNLLLGFLLWELINFLPGLSYLTIISALATKKVLTNCKDTPVWVLHSHMMTTLIKLQTLASDATGSPSPTSDVNLKSHVVTCASDGLVINQGSQDPQLELNNSRE